MRYISVNVAGLTISGGSGKIVLAPQGLDGWDDGVDVRRDVVDRAGASGSHDTPGYLDSRTISITGRVLADSPLECENIGLSITGLLAAGQSGHVQVSTESGTQWATCRLSSRTRFTPDFSRRNAVFQIQLWCPDPRKFGAVQSVPAGVGSATPVQNRGNYPASPVIVVAGPVSAGGYTVTGPGGEVFTVTTSPAAGVTHLINMHDGLLRVNGSISAGAGLVSRADTFTIPPGGKVNVTISKGGRVELYDTYI